MPALIRQQTPQVGEQLYQMLPHRYRMHDHSPVAPRGETEKIGFHKRFIRIFGDAFDQKMTEYAGLKDLMNPLKCPEAWLGHLSATLGLPLDPRVPADTARLLVDHLHTVLRVAGTDRCIRLLCYALTGISVRIWTPNGKGTVHAQATTYLTQPYRAGDDHITVQDATRFNLGDRITVTNGSRRSRQIITAIIKTSPGGTGYPMGILYLKDDLQSLYAANALVIKGDMTHTGRPGVWGDNVAIAGAAFPGIQTAIRMPRAKYCDPERGTKIYIEWHHWPTEELLDITSDLVSELSPGHLHIEHISQEHVFFIAGLSVANGRENAGS